MSDSYFDLPSRIEDAFAEIDSDIVMDLLNTNEDYAELSDRMDKLKTQYPVIDKMNEGSGEIRMDRRGASGVCGLSEPCPANGGHGATAHLLLRTYRHRGLPQKNQSAISTTKAVQRDLRRFFVGRNAKRVEKDALYKKFF